MSGWVGGWVDTSARAFPRTLQNIKKRGGGGENARALESKTERAREID
jgi:hypothetical protein